MNLIDRLRIESAILRYDFWLEMRGVRGSRRRDLRRELRTNLTEASADTGTTRALFGIGSPKELAHAATDTDPSRPRWSQGALWAAFVFGVVIFGCMFTAIAFTAGVEASGATGRKVHGFVFPWFGVDYSAQVDPGRSYAAGAGGVGGYFLGLPLLTFLLVAQPWRLLRRRRPAHATATTGDHA